MPGMTEFGYARADDGAYIAYRIDGDGPIDIVQQPDWPGNIDLDWDDAWNGGWLRELSTLGRLITHDHRGVGLSSRNVALPTLERRVADLVAVLTKLGVERSVLLGYLSSGAVNALLAATRPELVRSLIWIQPMARFARSNDYPWGNSWERLDDELAHLPAWGTVDYARWFLDDQGKDGIAIGTDRDKTSEALARISRGASTPDVARDLARIWYETDVRGVLPSVQVPTLLLTDDNRSNVEQTGYIAGLLPAATVATLRPLSNWSVEELAPMLDAIRDWLGVERPRASLDTILSTVLFTDIVDSTAKQVSLGDAGWKDLALAHHDAVRTALERWRGVENDTAGDGFYATFDGPARAIRCALEVTERVRDLGIEVRAGVHTGECEVIEDKCAGLTVSIGARVAAHAGPSEVLVSQTVKDLVAGSGLAFDDAGEHELKGVPERWRLYRVVA
jgi:class 3 adenylate cyclase/pimeloyl-ACP methyl ester carboxylesterase